MALPQRVQKQLDQADALLKQINAPEPAPAPSAAPDSTPAPVAADAAPPAPAPVEPAPAPAPTPPVPSALEQEFNELQQRYRSLQGIHRSKDEQIAHLQAEMLQLQERMKAPETRPEPAIDPNDAETFGADLVNMVKRVAETMFGAAAKAFDDRIRAVESRLEGTHNVVARTAEEVFYDRLGAQVPDYKAVNVDQGFLSWLAQTDPVYGVPRQEALNNAAAALDVDRVANVFKAYKATLAPAPAPAPRAQASLEKQIAPSGAASAPPPAAAGGKPLHTVAEVQAFYRAVQSGQFRGRDEEAARMEAMFNAALAEGRIVDRLPRAPI